MSYCCLLGGYTKKAGFHAHGCRTLLIPNSRTPPLLLYRFSQAFLAGHLALPMARQRL